MVEVATLELVARTEGLLKAEAALDRVTGAAIKTEAAADRMTAGTGRANVAIVQTTKSAGAMRSGFQNLGYQVQDFAVQVGSGQSATVALGQQLPQLLSGFGLVGVAIGTASAVLIPLIGHFVSAKDEAVEFDDVLEGLTATTDALAAAQEIMAMNVFELYEEYGVYAATVRDAAAALAELQIAQAEASLSSLILDNAEALEVFTGKAAGFFTSGEMIGTSLARISEEFGVTHIQALELQQAFTELGQSKTFEGQAAALARINVLLDDAGISADQLPPPLQQALIQFNELVIAGAELKREAGLAEKAIRALADGAPGAGWLSGAIGDAATLAETLWDAATAKASLSGGKRDDMTYGDSDWTDNSLGFTLPGEELVYKPPKGSKGGKGGKGGKSEAETFADQLEQLSQDLMTEKEVLDEWYAESQTILADRRALEILGEEEHKAALLAVEEEYQDQKAAIQQTEMENTLGHYNSLFGNMASIAKAGGDKASGVVKAFSVAQGLINSYLAYTQVLADPSLVGRPFLRTALAASTLASGLAQVAAMKSGGSGGGGSTGGSSIGSETAAAAAAPSRTVTVSIEGDGAWADILRDQIGVIAEALSSEQDIGGFVVA